MKQYSLKNYKFITTVILILLLGIRVGYAQQKVVKILAIGNSFSADAIEQHLHELAKAEGITTIIGNMFIGGCSLERHVNNARNNIADYEYRKVGIDGKRVILRNVTLEKALADEKWDYISLQQASQFSGMYDTYRTYLPELMRYVKQHAAESSQLVFHQTWAYAANSNNPGFKNYSNDQQKMYDAIVNAVRKACKQYKIKIVIPSGTAIQNARTSFIGDNMNSDGTHLEAKVGRYTAACTWFEKIFKRNVVGNSYAPAGLESEKKTIVQEAAHSAVKHPWKVTDLSKVCPDNCQIKTGISHK